MARIPNSEAIPRLKDILEREGVRAALAYINSLSSQRFTALYRFGGKTLHNVCFYDRENPAVTTCEDIPVTASYCAFVRDTGSQFATFDAPEDERLRGHPKQATVRSYCGVPLLDAEGRMFGTVCHFDFAPGIIHPVDVEILECMAGLMRNYGR